MEVRWRQVDGPVDDVEEDERRRKDDAREPIDVLARADPTPRVTAPQSNQINQSIQSTPLQKTRRRKLIKQVTQWQFCTQQAPVNRRVEVPEGADPAPGVAQLRIPDVGPRSGRRRVM